MGLNKKAVLIGFLAFALSLLRHLPTNGEEFGGGWESRMPLKFQVPFGEYWDEHGFITSRGAPRIYHLPTQEDESVLYGNHPPLAHWLIYAGTKLFGRTPFGLRFAPTLASAILAFLLASFAAQRVGVIAGFSATLLYAALPMATIYGRFANYEPFVLLFGFAASTSLLNNESKASIRLGWFALILAAFADWIGLLLGVLLVSWRLLSRRHRDEWRAVTIGGVSLILVMSTLFSLWAGSPQAALAGIQDAIRAVTRTSSELSWAEFWPNQATFLSTNYVLLSLIVTATAIVTLTLKTKRQEFSDLKKQVFVWTIIATSNVLVFHTRAIDHDFWWFYGLPVVVLATSWLIQRVFQHSKSLASAIVIVTCLSAVFATAHQARSQHRDWNRRMLAWSNERFDKDTMLVDTVYSKRGVWQMQANAWICRNVDSAEAAQRIVARFLNGDFTKNKLVLWFPAQLNAALASSVQPLLDDGAQLQVEGEFSFLTIYAKK